MNPENAPIHPAPAPSLQALQARLARLEGFLREDPGNEALRMDSFETALACGEWARAQAMLDAAPAEGERALGWQMRRGDFWLAQGRYEQARAVYEGLDIPQPPPANLHAVVQHNLAFIELAQAKPGQAIERLRPLVEDAGAMRSDTHELGSMLQRLWLRALHHDGQIDRALDWARQRLQSGVPDAALLGMASLVALDAGDFDAVRQWAPASIAQRPDGWRSPDGLVALASLALYAGDAPAAVGAAAEAVQRAPAEARAWSALAFAHLLAQALAPARAAFEHALQRMPAHIGTWHGLGWTQILLGELDGAMQSFMQALSLDRNFAESHGALAVVCALRGREEEARHEAELAQRLDASNLSGRYAQALLSGEGRDLDSLQRLTQRLLQGRMHALAGTGLADWIQARRPGDPGRA